MCKANIETRQTFFSSVMYHVYCKHFGIKASNNVAQFLGKMHFNQYAQEW